MTDHTVLTRRLTALLAAPAFLALILSAGCATQEKKQEAHLTQLLIQLPGHYDNAQQVREDAAAGVAPPHLPLQWSIQRVDSPGVGKNVFYAREAAADDVRRVFARRVWSFAQSADGKRIVQAVYVFADPMRWRNADAQLELFSAMLVSDLKELSGCELIWQATPSALEGKIDAKRCHSSAVANGENLEIEQRALLTADGLALTEGQFDLDERLQGGAEADPVDRFQKHGQ